MDLSLLMLTFRPLTHLWGILVKDGDKEVRKTLFEESGQQKPDTDLPVFLAERVVFYILTIFTKATHCLREAAFISQKDTVPCKTN